MSQLLCSQAKETFHCLWVGWDSGLSWHLWASWLAPNLMACALPGALLMGCNALRWSFSFSLECVCRGQMPCIQPVWTGAGVSELLFPAVRLQISSFHCHWRLLHMRFAAFQMCEVSTPCGWVPPWNSVPSRTLGVLDHWRDSDLNTDYMWMFPQEGLTRLSIYFFVTQLKAVNWKKFFVLGYGSGIRQINCVGNNRSVLIKVAPDDALCQSSDCLVSKKWHKNKEKGENKDCKIFWLE